MTKRFLTFARILLPQSFPTWAGRASFWRLRVPVWRQSAMVMAGCLEAGPKIATTMAPLSASVGWYTTYEAENDVP
jgi:hypothetical protein